MRIFAAILLAYPFGSIFAGGIADILSSLRSAECYHATAKYQVLMSLQDDVNYTISLTSQTPAAADTLAPCDYLIEWQALTEDMTPSTRGFSAYSAGNLYNFRGDRMTEYHMPADSATFRPSGSGAARIPGLQRRTQFSNLLPQFIADEIETMLATQEEYACHFTADTLVAGTKCQALTATQSFGGNVYREVLYAFDPATALPFYIKMENNPGALAEQTIICEYSYPATAEPCPPISEESLRELYPEVFDRYRESTYVIDHLPGQAFPAFALPTSTGERFSYRRGERFNSPTFILLLDATSGFARPTVEAMRQTAAMSSSNTDIIWAFNDNNIDEIEAITGPAEVGEHILINARSLARTCGASALPVIILCRRDGTVATVVKGYKSDLTSTLLQALKEL